LGRVLIVDDEIANVELLARRLEAIGCQTQVASSGERAIALARSEQPDLILLDVMMPGIDGWQTCRRLKSQPETADIPVIFVTAKDRYEDLSKGFEVGGVDYLTKPFEPIELAARVRSAIFTKRLQDELRKTAGDRALAARRAERGAGRARSARQRHPARERTPPGRERIRRRRPHRPGPHESSGERGEAHAVRRDGERRERARPHARIIDRDPRPRHRTRHQRGRRSPHLRPVLSGCRAKPRRHRPRPGLLQAGRRAPRRHHQRRQSWRKRRDHPVHVARSRPRRRGEIAGMFGRILRDAFPLRRGEWGLGLFLYALLTLMVASDWIGKLGADSLFVKRWGVNYVPVMYIVTPIAMLAVSAMIFFFVDRVRRRTLLLWYVAGVTVLSVAIQGGVWVQGQFDYGWLVQPISYVFAHGVKETIYILFWVYAGNLYDAEQSKRLFPFFAGSVLVGKILGGAIGAAVAPVIHAENCIGAQAVGFLVCFV